VLISPTDASFDGVQDTHPGTKAVRGCPTHQRYQAYDSAFAGSDRHVAAVEKPGFGLGFSCKDGTTHAIYITPEEVNDDKVAGASALAPKLKMRIDENPIVDLEVEIQSFDGKLRGVAGVDVDLLIQVRDAKRRVAVALQFRDELYHEQSFDVVGSTEAFKRLISNCASKGKTGQD
jgi:hypothetical protein